jgi:glycerate kinase
VKIVIAPDSFKESMSAADVAKHIEAGFREVFPEAEIVKVPMADGGEGTVDALVAATGGTIEPLDVIGPLGETVRAFWGLTGDRQTAVIEMAAASGLALVPPSLRNPLRTTSYGTGQLIRAALETGVRHLIIGIGGSATNDGGSGMVQALGAGLLDTRGRQVGFGGEALAKLERIDTNGLDHRLRECKVEVACDVDNPLTGPRGASAVFGPQKGATPPMVGLLEANLVRYAELILRDVGADVAGTPGSGAAGGMGAALMAFLGATLRPGVEIVMEAVNLEAAVRSADLVVTGEGRMDSQTVYGKTPVGVARVAKRYNKPVIGIAGSLAQDVAVVHEHGIDAVFSILHRICTMEEAVRDTAENLRRVSRNIAATLKSVWGCTPTSEGWRKDS